jgi:hypothetical protein
MFCRYDLGSTFDIAVGKLPLPQQTFTVHTNLLTERSEFFRAARSSQWLTDPMKPVDLEDDDPEIVSGYLSCVYFGNEALRADVEDQAPPEADPYKPKILKDAFAWTQEECEKRYADDDIEETAFAIACDTHFFFLAKVYLQADKLQDLTATNLVIDEFIRFSKVTRRNLAVYVVNHIYESTVHGSPFRKLMRDFRVHETSSREYLEFHVNKYHEDFCRDTTVELLRALDGDSIEPSKCEKSLGISQKMCADSCAFHLHNEHCPRCTPERSVGSCACA